MNLTDKHLPRMISDLIFFMDHSLKYDGKTVDGIISYYEKNGFVSCDQFHVLSSVYEKWFVKEFVDKKKGRDPEAFYHFEKKDDDDY